LHNPIHFFGRRSVFGTITKLADFARTAVCGKQLAVGRMKSHAERVSQSRGKNLWRRGCRVNIDSQHRSVERSFDWATRFWHAVVGCRALSEVEQTIRPEF
jgi:hypothetical protein